MYYINQNQKMNKNDWNKIKYMHFKTENWGEPFEVSYFLVNLVEQMRITAKSPCILTCPAYAKTGHSKNSAHYFGWAADLRFPKLSILEMYRLANLFPFSGIGLYPKNNNNSFMHVDVKPVNLFQKRRTWLGLNSKDGQYEYLSLSEKNLLRYIIKN